MSGPTPVTLLILTFNQELFVASAVRAALAQDYPDLQVLISDDCSSDRTFEILEAEVRAYVGPHCVLLRRTERNCGLVPHFFEAAALADGELVVGAAGDDISYPDRVSQLVEHWQASGADAICSDWDVVDERGDLVRRGRPPGEMDLRLHSYFGGEVTPITGATAAYSAAVFRNILPPPEPIFAEDLYLTLMLHWRRRKVAWLNRALVAYRVHEGALTHSDLNRQSVLEQERATERHSRRNALALNLFERLTTESPAADGWGAPAVMDRAAIANDAAFNHFRSHWLQASAAEQLRAFLRFRSNAQRRWLLPRILGFRGLMLLKRARSVIRGGLRKAL